MLLAVYGSLRKGGTNHKAYLKDYVGLGSFESIPIYNMYDLGQYPGITKGGLTSITFEVYDVAEYISRFDVLEGYDPNSPQDSYYIREVINTPYGKAFTYILNVAKADKLYPKIPNGDWIDYWNVKKVIHV